MLVCRTDRSFVVHPQDHPDCEHRHEKADEAPERHRKELGEPQHAPANYDSDKHVKHLKGQRVW